MSSLILLRSFSRSGKYGQKQICQGCPEGWKRGEHDSVQACLQCNIGETSVSESMACVACSEGLYGSNPGVCTGCQDGQYSDIKRSLSCKNCDNGQVVGGGSVCQKCRLGKHGSTNGVCVACEGGKISSQEGLGECLPCDAGLIPNSESTGCANSPWVTISDCKYESEYFNDTDPLPNNHECIACPFGAWCKDQQLVRVRAAAQLQPKDGFSALSWDNFTFGRCPSAAACHSDYVTSTHGCRIGHSPNASELCSQCLDGFASQGMGEVCEKCPDEGTTGGFFFGAIMLAIIVFAFLVYDNLNGASDMIPIELRQKLKKNSKADRCITKMCSLYKVERPLSRSYCRCNDV